jgi:hypothetical protein
VHPDYQEKLTDSLVALRSFTLESGQEELERLARRRKERPDDLGTDLMSESRRGSADSIRSPTSSHQRAPQLSDVPEEDGTFAIGDDEDEETDDEQPTPAASTPTEQPSRASSVSSSVDDAVPTQLRGMSEKARGKMPGKHIHSQLLKTLLIRTSWHANLLPSKQHHKSQQLRSTLLYNGRLRAHLRVDRVLAPGTSPPHNPHSNWPTFLFPPPTIPLRSRRHSFP